jgi:hypothetical protein
MSQRNTTREGDQINHKFGNLYVTLKPQLDDCPFNNATGKVEVPEDVEIVVNAVNHDWNNLAIVMNRKFKFTKAELGAIKRKFQADILDKEIRMFFFAVSQELAQWNLTSSDIEIEFIEKMRQKGYSPAAVCNARILDIEPEKISPFNFKHKHSWRVVDFEDRFTIVCSECFKHYAEFTSMEAVLKTMKKMPTSNISLIFKSLKF